MPLPLIMAEGLNLSQHQPIDAVDSANTSYRLLPGDRVATVKRLEIQVIPADNHQLVTALSSYRLMRRLD